MMTDLGVHALRHVLNAYGVFLLTTALLLPLVAVAQSSPDKVNITRTAKDLPGINKFGLIHADQPVFAEEKVRFLGDALALVIADTEETARGAQSISPSQRLCRDQQ